MLNWTRRDFIKAGGASLASGLAGAPFVASGAARKARVVVIGGGYGGAIAAKYVKRLDPQIDVTLVERNKHYVSCPFSNEVLSGERDIESLTFDYQGLAARDIRVIHDEATAVDPVRKTVSLKNGKALEYDRLVVSPGIQFNWKAIEGCGPEMEKTMPHAWKAGEQTLLLRKQLEAMKDGGTAIIVVPPAPFRCPPGPYERAAQMCAYFKHHKPKSRVLILDANTAMSKRPLFEQAWAALYPGMITWTPASNSGKVLRVDQSKRTLVTEFDSYTSDVINFIAPHKAGQIAHIAGLTDAAGWCPVDPFTMESTKHKAIHVIGDASAAGDMPKSAHSAGSQAKATAAAIVAAINGQTAPNPYYVNTCYSLVAPDWGFSVAGLYKADGDKIAAIPGSVVISPTDVAPFTRKEEAAFGLSWLANITAEAFS
ncbi:MAG: FAD-dependent oxidoreductase [Betaproteobacteria bacterium]|nr:FAD-dependent oxidoreductase [Betaproteobacteria bacterium]